MITQSQIAKMAGVSRATVERVINNRGDVSEDTRKLVLEIIKKTDYRPNRAGKTLAIQQKNLKIGCIIIHADNPFYQELNKGIIDKAAEFKSYGIQVIIEQVEFDVQKQLEKIDELISQQINALVIQPIAEPALARKLNEIERLNIPIVTVNTDLPDFTSSFCYVGNDFYLCGKTAANFLNIATQGHCNIGVITGFSKAKSHADRIEGFRDYIQNFSGMNIVAVAENRDDEMESYYITKTMLLEHPEIDSVFLVAGGVHGAGTAIKKTSQETHRSFKVISFDDVPTTRDLVRDGTILATICQQPVRQGRLAMSVLFDYLIDGIVPENKKIFTDIQIKLRANIDT